ncbi:hypothetical protein GJAV_G00246700 [Gymnothorax javanicus]|nr:hypothetical protein GJAV_G00246700 [Gymnothorax javanicus]
MRLNGLRKYPVQEEEEHGGTFSPVGGGNALNAVVRQGPVKKKKDVQLSGFGLHINAKDPFELAARLKNDHPGAMLHMWQDRGKQVGGLSRPTASRVHRG